MNQIPLTSEKYSLRDDSPELSHRFLGTNMYSTDIDSLQFLYGSTNGTWIESTGNKNVALIDYKHGNTPVLKPTLSFRAQQDLANAALLPFFIVVYYLEQPKFSHPMYWVVPGNFKAFNKVGVSTWFTPKGMSRFLHSLRGLRFDQDEPLPIPKTESEAKVRSVLLTGTSLPDDHLFCLKHLCDEKHGYKSPLNLLTGTNVR